MLRVGKIMQYQIVNPKIFHNKLEIKRDSNLSFYPLVGFKQTKLGAMKLNKPDNNNMMNEECSDELFRFLNSYHHDHSVENIWVEGKGKTFLGGADFDQLKQNQLYLDKLHRLSIMIARLNKPVFAKVSGGVRGISAYVLTMLSTPIGTENSSLRLDQTSRGFIPIFGGSHRLNRLPCNIGLYLALTGDKIDHEQMARLGFLKAAMSEQYSNKTIRKNLSDANLFMQNTMTANVHSVSELRRQAMILEKMKKFDYFIAEAQKDMFSNKRNFYGKFALNQYNLAKVDYENIRNPYNSLSPKNVKVNNYFEMRHDRPFQYLKKKEMIEEARIDNNILSNVPSEKLIKIFDKNSLVEILNALRQDGSQWAAMTEKKIRSKDPLAQLLTFRLFKEGKQSSWIQCLEREYTVARRLINNSDVKIVEHDGGSLKIFTNNHSGKQIQDISFQDVEYFFNPQQSEDEKFEHDSPKYALYPTSDYWKKVPDSGRHYLNRTLFDDPHLVNHHVEVRRFLQMNNIDYRDRSYNLQTLTRAFYLQDMYQRLFQLEKKRLRETLRNPIELKKNRRQRKQLLEAKKHQKQFADEIKAEVKKYFKKRFQERYSDLMQTADIAGKEEKMDIFRSYVDTMTQNIVMNGRQYEENLAQSALKHGGIVRFDKHGKNVFEAESDWENNNPALVELREIAKRKGSVEELSQQAQEMQKRNDMIFERQKSEWELEEEKKNAEMIHYYKTDILDLRYRARTYRALIEKAALTSYEMYELLGWENTDIQSTITNAPKEVELFRQFAEKALSYEDDTEKKIAELNENYKRLAQLNLIQTFKREKAQMTLQKQNLPIFFDLNVIPKPFKEYTLKIMRDVLTFFTEKYDKEKNKPESTQGGSKLINQWVENSFKADLTEFLKYDVQYVFSYIASLQVKEMINQAQRNKGTVQLFNKYSINFSGYPQKKIYNQLINYFYVLVDLHGEAKHRIIMPQTKLMDFLARKKLHKQLSEDRGISYESVVTLIAKDRKRLNDYIQGKTSLLGYEPQHMLNFLETEKQKNQSYMPPLQQITSKQKNFRSQVKNEQLNRLKPEFPSRSKKLVMGFNGYLMRFESLLQKIAGSDMFLPQSLRRQVNKKAYMQVKDILKTNISHEDWIKQKLSEVVRILLEFRFEKQKNMTKGQLALFDSSFSGVFSPQMMSILIGFEGFKEENMARQIIEQQFQSSIPKEVEQNMFYEIKKDIKNPKALEMINNLVMTRNLIKDRFYELEDDNKRKKPQQDPTGEQLTELIRQMNVSLPVRTRQRLLGQAFRYKDDESPNNLGNKAFIRQMLGTKEDRKMISPFMNEITDIIGTIEKDDFTAELTQKIQRIRMADL